MAHRISHRRVWTTLLAVVFLLGGGGRALVAAEVTKMIELVLHGQRIEGLPLSWDDSTVHLLGRDGRLWEFSPSEATQFRQTAAQFRAYSPSEFRAVLLREMGDGYEVSGTSHYLVAHPSDQRDRWAPRFEDLYRSFVRYFSVRGFEPATPPFPLVGIVCRNRDEFVRYADRQAAASADPHDVPAGGLKRGGDTGVLGFYQPDSNRISLYDMDAKNDAVRWQQNASVLIHETTHQIAFNSGIHSRYCQPPLWAAEGLATLFEAPGVYDSRANPQPADRVNRGRLDDFRKGVQPHHRPALLASIVASDELFRSNPGAAYAEAWALTFFLSETEPHKWVQYLKRTAEHPPFREYTAAERTVDFTALFGNDWRMLEARFLRYMGGVK